MNRYRLDQINAFQGQFQIRDTRYTSSQFSEHQVVEQRIISSHHSLGSTSSKPSLVPKLWSIILSGIFQSNHMSRRPCRGRLYLSKLPWAAAPWRLWGRPRVLVVSTWTVQQQFLWRVNTAVQKSFWTEDKQFFPAAWPTWTNIRPLSRDHNDFSEAVKWWEKTSIYVWGNLWLWAHRIWQRFADSGWGANNGMDYR